jgi:thiamine biosynthesis lipoprotein
MIDPADRRAFLQPRYLAQAAGQVLESLGSFDGDANPEPVGEAALLRLTRRAMATRFEVLLPYGTPGALETGTAAFDEIDCLERQLTVYRATSEVSRLNQLAPQVPVPVERGLFGLLTLAAQISSESEGAFDITAGALIKAWGFYKGPRQVPTPEALAAALAVVGMRHVKLDPEARTVRFLRPGLEINLGSIGKGYALDRVAVLLRTNYQVTCALLHGGHSSVYAMGTEPGGLRGWEVGIRHPWDPTRRLATVRLRDRALGTSAATFQHLEYNGRKLGHILDPRSGWPAEGMASASVVASTAAAADALATAFFILGVEKTAAYCANHPEIGAILLPDGDSARPVIVNLRPPDVALRGS